MHLNAFPFNGLFGCQWFSNLAMINSSNVSLNVWICSWLTLEFLERTSLRNLMAERTSSFIFVVFRSISWQRFRMSLKLRSKLIFRSRLYSTGWCCKISISVWLGTAPLSFLKTFWIFTILRSSTIALFIESWPRRYSWTKHFSRGNLQAKNSYCVRPQPITSQFEQ